MKLNIKKITDLESKKVQLGITVSIIIVLSLLITFLTLALSNDVVDFNAPIFVSYFKDWRLLLLNFLPIFFLFSLIYIISNRLWVGFLISSVLWIGMAIVNNFKLYYRDEPFSFIDIVLFRESLEMAGEYNMNLTQNTVLMIIGLVVLTLILFFLGNYRLRYKKHKFLSLGIIVLSAIGLYSSVYTSNDVYADLGDKSIINIWSKTQQFQVRGFVYPFINSINESFEPELENYDEEKAKSDLSKYESESIPEDEKVNIVAIMLESYNDFSKFDGIEWNKDPYEYFHGLKSESYSGKLITNVFGGGTVNTERSFLTGIQHHPRYISDTNSYVWYMREQGYFTEFMHPIYGWFYNRRNINPNMGFENFDYYENKYSNYSEDFLKDYDFFDYVIEGFEDSVSKGKPYFNFSLTYQNHGPYSTAPLENPYIAMPEGFSSKEHKTVYNEINNYFNGIHETNLGLEKLIDYYRSSDEPTVVVLFGDHNPFLGENGIGFDMMGINIDLNTIDGAVNYYETPYIFWGNEAAKSSLDLDFKGSGDTISPNFLMNELFEYIGWDGSRFMQYSSYIKDEISVFNNVIYRQNGDFVNSLSEDYKQRFLDFKNVEYYYMTNKFKK